MQDGATTQPLPDENVPEAVEPETEEPAEEAEKPTGDA